MTTNITDAQRKTFAALTSGRYSNFALFSCFADGKPVTAIVAVSRDGEEYTLTPLFITIPDDTVLTDHDGALCAAA